MNKLKYSLTATTLAVAGVMGTVAPAAAQVAGGTTTVESSFTESTKLAMGWSVKETLMGKSIYNDAGEKVGNVEDLIISPDRNVSYVIVAAGGFVGIGQHDVAIPVTQIQDKAGKLIMSGATKDKIKAMAEFTYATDTMKRDAFLTAADKDIASGRSAIATLQKKAGAANAMAKAKIDQDITGLQTDVKSAEGKLLTMKQGSAMGWRQFEADVSAATTRLRKAVDKALS